MHLSTILTSVALLSTTGLAQFTLEDDYLADGNFFDMFSFFTAGDPTHGAVSYVDQGTASKSGLISFSQAKGAYMGVDYTNKAPNGRASVRVTSNKAYDSGLIILDLAHMPGSICGTWPAFWMVGPNWPAGGEIDIIEGVNDGTTNQATLHTNAGCTISNTNSMLGTVLTSNCDVNAAGQYANAGCGIGTANTQTYGDGFNKAGGGVYATNFDPVGNTVKIYFFPRSSIPADITAGKPNPSSWGSPLAAFGGGCSIKDHFKSLQIVFDNTFCGDWAGSVWGQSSCASKASTCQSFVANNPGAFQDAYWQVNSLKVYQANGGSSNPAPSSSSSSSSIVKTSPAASNPTNVVVVGGNGQPAAAVPVIQQVTTASTTSTTHTTPTTTRTTSTPTTSSTTTVQIVPTTAPTTTPTTTPVATSTDDSDSSSTTTSAPTTIATTASDDDSSSSSTTSTTSTTTSSSTSSVTATSSHTRHHHSHTHSKATSTVTTSETTSVTLAPTPDPTNDLANEVSPPLAPTTTTLSTSSSSTSSTASATSSAWHLDPNYKPPPGHLVNPDMTVNMGPPGRGRPTLP